MAPSTGMMGKAKRNAHFNKLLPKVAKGKATLENENLEEAVSFFQTFASNVKQSGIIWKIGGMITIGAIVLFMIKLSNTSEMALRYNQHAQEEMGMWVLGILFVAAISVFFAFMTFIAKKNYTAWRGLLVAELRRRAGEGGDQKALYESLLRELGA